MTRHFHEELEALKQTLLAMGGLVEGQIRRVMQALLERDGALAQQVIDGDARVNAYDVEVDETCVELLALHQPAAGDLRFITTAMKIVTDPFPDIKLYHKAPVRLLKGERIDDELAASVR